MLIELCYDGRELGEIYLLRIIILRFSEIIMRDYSMATLTPPFRYCEGETGDQ